MADPKRPPTLLDAFGFAVDLSLVDKATLEVVAVSDTLLAATAPDLEVMPGIAAHGMAVRNTKLMRRPMKWGRKLVGLGTAWAPHLDVSGHMVLPGGAHPFYDPQRNASMGNALAPEVRAVCEKVFGCAQHGWSNSQGFHLEIHFGKPADFGKLHAAVRLLMPLIPGLAAASPILEGRVTGLQCARLQSHLRAFERVPELLGEFVPEPVFDPEEHDRQVLGPISQALAKHDPKRLLDPQRLDARGATANFDRDTLTLHVIDGQECPSANMAVAEMIIVVLRALVRGRWVSNYLQRAWGSDDLQQLMLATIKDGGQAAIANRDYLLMLGLMKQDSMPAAKVWQHLFVELYSELSENARLRIGHILEHGTLAERIVARVGKRASADRIRETYAAMFACWRSDAGFL